MQNPANGGAAHPAKPGKIIALAGMTFPQAEAVGQVKTSFSLTGELAPDFGPLRAGNGERMSAWFSRVYREYEAGNLTPLWRDVLRALGRFDACRFGIFPSHEFLARRARCSVRTVQRALEAARALGLVDWTAQRVRASWRLLRASNRYVLKTPEGPVQPGPHGRRATTGQAGRGVTQPITKPAQERSGGTIRVMLEAARGLPDLLKARREAMEARWKAATAARIA
jgi:hypothetical protein